MKNKKIAIFNLDGTIDKGDTFLAFIIRIFLSLLRDGLNFLILYLGILLI